MAHPRDAGAALISAMLIVSIMAVVAVSLLETLRSASRLSINLEVREQAQLYAIGAEQYAAGSVKAFWQPGQERQLALDAWIGQPFLFPIPGGTLRGTARDGTHCFNLNSLVRFEDGSGRVANPDTIAEFVRLMGHLDVLDAEATGIATAAADWIDSDQVAGFGGAESDYYGALDDPYRAADGPMVDRTELKQVRGVTPDIYARLAPFLCTHPTEAPATINLNSLTPDGAPLLAAILGDDILLEDAVRIIEERPAGGFPQRALIQDAPLIQALGLDPVILERFDIRSGFVELSVQVSYQSVHLDMLSRLQISDTGDITTLSRRYGSVE